MMSFGSGKTGGQDRTRWYHVVLVGVVAVAFVGFFIGTGPRSYEHVRSTGFTAEEERISGSGAARPAPTYGELTKTPYDENRQWRNAVDEHRGSGTDEGEPRVRSRSDNRAYDGAPPTVPHPVRERSAEACVACHGEGVRVGAREGPPMSHEFMTNCIQCHASSNPKRPFAAEPPKTVASTNSFVGLDSPERGPRAYDGAPPRIPHRTAMRSACTSCHGKFGRPGPMSHELRTNCRQCHAATEGPPLPFRRRSP